MEKVFRLTVERKMNSFANLLKFICIARSLCTLSNAALFSRHCPIIVDRRNDDVVRKKSKDLSALYEVMGIVRTMPSNLCSSGSMPINLLSALKARINVSNVFFSLAPTMSTNISRCKAGRFCESQIHKMCRCN